MAVLISHRCLYLRNLFYLCLICVLSTFFLTGDESAIHTIDPTVLIENQQKVSIVKKNVKQMAVKFDGGSSKNLTSGILASTTSGAGPMERTAAVNNNSNDKSEVDTSGSTGTEDGSVGLKSETDAASLKDDDVTFTSAEDA